MLWYGSSSAYYHDFYDQVAAWVSRSDAGPQWAAGIIGRSGTGIDIYVHPDFKAQYGLEAGQTPLSAIADHKPQMVILQTETAWMGDPDRQQALLEAIDRYGEASRAAGARLVIYEMGWRSLDKPDAINDEGVRANIRGALRNNALVIPCRRAWKKALAGQTQAGVALALHDLPDTTHPGLHGLYLNLCCAYMTLTGKSPIGLPPEQEHVPMLPGADGKPARGQLTRTRIDARVAEYLQDIARQTCEESQALMGSLHQTMKAGTAVEHLDIP